MQLTCSGARCLTQLPQGHAKYLKAPPSTSRPHPATSRPCPVPQGPAQYLKAPPSTSRPHPVPQGGPTQYLKPLHVGLAEGLWMGLSTDGSRLGSVPLQLGLLGHHSLEEERGGRKGGKKEGWRDGGGVSTTAGRYLWFIYPPIQPWSSSS